MNIRLLACLVLALFATSVHAQDSDGWDWKITPYLWMVGIDGDLSIGPIDQAIDVSFSDIVSDLDIGGSIYAELGKGKHAFHFDYTYLRLKPDPTALSSPPFPEGATLSTKMTNNIFEPAYNYRFDGAGGSTALVLGARYLDIEMRMTPSSSGPIGPLKAGPSWWDYFVGVKTHNQISTNWDFDFYGTIGTGGSDLPWTLQAGFARRYSNDNRLILGFRLWNIDYSKAEGVLDQYVGIDTRFYGFLVGYEFN
jgi:hypothetical protein